MRAAGIIGHGVVGQAQERMFRKAGYRPVIYDPKYGSAYPQSQLEQCDFAVICVGTPALPDGSQDTSAVADAYYSLPVGLPVMIRSTVRPGCTDALIQGLALPSVTAFVPEFLTERLDGSWPESTDVPFVILGGAAEAHEFFLPVLRKAAGHRNVHLCSALEAELAKYAANLHWAVRVTFVNEMAGICEALGAEWERVRALWLKDRRVSPAYTAMAGFPSGFGGACWPKDLSALIWASSDQGYEPEFLHAVQDANERFRG